MRIVSITVILAAVLIAAIGTNPGNSFWGMIYGYAVMLAIFNILNLKIHWAAGFGGVAYAAMAYKMISAPFTAGAVTPNLLQISGVVVAAFYCLSLALAGIIKNRQPVAGMPKITNF